MGTSKCGLYEQLPFIYRLKIYTLFINGGNETAFLTVICYIRVALSGRFNCI